VLEGQIAQQAMVIDQLKEQIDHLWNPFQHHIGAQQPDSSATTKVSPST